MKIAIIKPTESLQTTGGVLVQAVMWKEGLEALGNEVILVNFWEDNDWKRFDIILVIQFGGMFRTLARDLVKINPNLVLAPIIDTNLSHLIFKILTRYWGSQKYLGLTSRFHDLYLMRNCFKLFLARSEYERAYITRCLGVEEERCKIVPLSFRNTPPDYFPEKEKFCLHVSRLTDPTKNVNRIIEAAQKYGFPLVLAGNITNEQDKNNLLQKIASSENIRYAGQLDDATLEDYYRRAAVFALPSINEGVGMVALEAASYGCEIVLTKLGAPKEYYDQNVYLVDPYSVDEIGNAIRKALEGPGHQPGLQKYVCEKYNIRACSKLLHDYLELTVK